MKIKKSELKQLIKEELEATMDEGFLDKLTGRYRDGTAIYIPSQSIDVYDLRGNTPLGGNPKPRIFAHARIELFAPKGAALDPDDPSENRTINVVVPMYRQSENPKKAIKEIVAKLKNLNTRFMAPNYDNGDLEEIRLKWLASRIFSDVLKIAEKKDLDKYHDEWDQKHATDDEIGLPRNQGYQYNE